MMLYKSDITAHSEDVKWQVNLRMKLLLGPSVAVCTVFTIITLRWVAPLVTMLHAWTRG